MKQNDTSTAVIASPADQVQNPDTRMVTLDVPLVRGDTQITTLTIRKPNAGALRGVTLMAIAQIDVVALQTVLPRITDPILTPQEIARLDPADLMAVGSTVSSFFISRADRIALGLQTE